jgi:hypothetical protein
MKASDSRKVVFKNMGNNHAYPMMWVDNVTFTAATEVVVASGIAFHGMTLADYAAVIVTPQFDTTATFCVIKDTGANTITVKSSASVTGDVAVQFTLGGNADQGYIDDYACRANTGAVKNF